MLSQKITKDEGVVTRKVKVDSQTTVTTHQLVKNVIVSLNGNDSFTLCGQDQVDQATMLKNHEELRGAVCKVMYMDQPKETVVRTPKIDILNEEDNDNVQLCEWQEVERTEKYSGQPADPRECSTEDAEEYVSTLDSSASPTVAGAPELLCQTLSYSAPENYYKNIPKKSNTEKTHLRVLMDEVDETTRPQYECCIKSPDETIDIGPTLKIGILKEKDNYNVQLSEKQGVERTEKEKTHLALLTHEVDETTRPKYKCKQMTLESVELTQFVRTPKIGILKEEDNDNVQLCEWQEVESTVKYSSQPAGLLEDAEEQRKINVQEQFDTASKWLLKFTSKVEVKTHGQQAVRDIIYLANKITEDLNKQEKEDMRRLITETEQVLTECSKKYDQKNSSVLMELIRDLKQGIERGVVTRVVEDFMEAEAPLADLDILADHENDERKQTFLLEKKIAELLAHLSRVIKTARLIADTDTRATVSTQFNTCSEEANSLASMLVKAAELRVTSPNDKVVIEEYKSLLVRYAESLSKIRDLCDQSVDPMDFVRAAGEKIQLMREESTKHNDSMKWEQTSTAIAKLGHRVFCVGRSSSIARDDPELQDALLEVQKQLTAATPPADTCRTPDWKHTTAQILQATEEVESLLCGEYIFKKQPEPNHPIYNEAKNLYTAIRDWSSHDNEIVAVAKRMAVLMAKLADFMNNDKKREVLMTSKSIVTESHEVTRLAEKLAHKCTDRRIKSNLLQDRERIQTVSGQLKMLISVKASSFGRHGIREDKDDMDMLVGNAQSLMLSIRDVVKGAESASVKIMSQRGPRMKWVRRNIYWGAKKAAFGES